MKKLSALLVAFMCMLIVNAQDSTALPSAKDTVPSTIDTSMNGVDTSAAQTLPITIPDSTPSTPTSTGNNSSPKPKGPLNFTGHAQDHLLIQLGYDNWAGKNDSIRMKGISRSFAMYFMYDLPVKTNPHFSVGLGLGISSTNIYFSNTDLDITGKTGGSALNFTDRKDTTHFKKYKLVTTYLEVPVELRWVKDVEHPKKSFKAAAGFKFGTMLSATTKGKNLQNSSNQLLSSYIEKEKSKKYFNTTRISLTGRVGIGSISLFGNYQLNQFIKTGAGPDVRPFTIGITISGL